MLKTLDEIKNAEISATGVINGVDNPNLLSVDSTEPIKTEIDQIKSAEEAEKSEKTEENNEQEKKEGATPAEKEKEAEKAKGTEEEKEEKNEEEKNLNAQSVKQKTSAEERIGKLTKKWRSAERERDFERARNAELQEELRKLKAQIPAANRPAREDFEDEDDYIEALAEWKVESKLQEKFAKAAEDAQADEEKSKSAAVDSALSEILERGREKYADFDDVVYDKDLAMTQTLVDIISESEIAEELFYFLGKNPDIAYDLSELSPVKAAREIGKLEEKVAATIPKPNVFTLGGEDPDKKDSRREVVVKKVTRTPEPIQPVKSTGAIEKDPNDMTFAEYRAWRERNK